MGVDCNTETADEVVLDELLMILLLPLVEPLLLVESVLIAD